MAAHYDIFRHHLLMKFPAYGHALWEPDPGNLYPAVRVGDVGYIREGKFRRLFNVLLPAEDESHQNFGVPEYHEPLSTLSIRDHIEIGKLGPNNFCSAKVTPIPASDRQVNGPDDIPKVTFYCPRKEGAVISLPIYAKAENTVASADFAKWMVSHIDRWFAWARQLGLGVDRMEDIVLVTGAHCTRSCTNVAFPGGQADAQASFGAKVDHSGDGVSINWQFSHERNRGVVLNHGPGGKDLPEDQCIFIRGFRIIRKFKIMPPKLKGAAGPNPDPEGDDEEPDEELMSIPTLPEYQDPLHLLLKYIAEEAPPHCDMVLIHDDDFARLEGMGDITRLNSLQSDIMLGHIRSLQPPLHYSQIDLSSTRNSVSPDTESACVVTLSNIFDTPSPPSTSPAPQSTHVGTPLPQEGHSLHLATDWSSTPSTVSATPAQLALNSRSDDRHLILMGRELSITDIDNEIAAARNSLSFFSRSHSQYIMNVHLLAMTRFARYQLSHEKEDLDMCILHFTEAIFLPPMSRTGPFHNFFQTLFHLASALLERSEEFEQLEGIKYSSEYLRHLRRFPLDSFDIPRTNVTTSLIRALRTQVRLGVGNGTQNIKEMVVLCKELLSSSKSAAVPTAAFSYFREAANIEFNRGLPTEILGEVVECLRDARKVHPPDSYDALHEVTYALAYTLGTHFVKTHSKEEATAVLERILEPGGFPDSFRVVSSSLAIALAHGEKRCGPKFRRTSDISDIEESIKHSRLSLDATHASDPRRINRLGSLRSILFLAFQETKNISYLDESITVGYDMLQLKTPIARQGHFLVTQTLVSSLLTRERLLGQIEDRHEAIRLISSVINDQYARDSDRFRLSCHWAILARSAVHPTTSTAYKTAMSLMQKSFSFAPTVSVQHTHLVAMGEDCQRMPLDYASYQIRLGRFEEAVETLEQGRALLWSEMRGLRTPVCQLIEEDSPLAKRFAEINQELETLTISVTPSGGPEVEDGVHLGKDGMDQFGRLVIERKKLVEERDALILQIQSRPGLEGFLGAPSFDTLRSAASRGPVIIINHCEWRSDIMIIFHNSLPCSIPTTETFFTRANRLRDELVEARKKGLDSVEYQEALCSVLKGLYELVGEPVIKRLRVLGVPEQSRIWWCPTSVFCSLPLHAMGPIPSSNGRERYFSDLYIPSYTPSLSALIESRRANVQTPKRPSLLLVAQPDDLLPGVNGEIKVIRRALHSRLTVESLVSGDATPSSVLEGLRRSQFAHFACRGVPETGNPFDSSFKLHSGSRLTLLDIVRSRLPDAEFAFLSCCHAAKITEESAADEALHLTAAMQYCGFRSVVGTMWETADVDGQDLAKSFYKSLFSSQETGVPYYERTAGALRYATQRLREKRGVTLGRWVNFVHYGA